jgi:hypothetical protein
MVDLLEKLLGATIAIFMAGSRPEKGLKLDLKRLFTRSVTFVSSFSDKVIHRSMLVSRSVWLDHERHSTRNWRDQRSNHA